MDQEQLQKQIAEYFSKLPQKAQEIFASMEWMKSLEDISKKYSLTDAQIASLGTETTLLLLGIVHPNEYSNFLKTDLSLPEDISNQLTSDINLKILNVVRADLEKTHTTNTTEIADKEYGGGVKLDDKLKTLPKEVQNALLDSNYQANLYSIANKHKLSIEQMGILENTTNKVLLGIIKPDAYNQTLSEKIHLPTDKVSEIVSDVNETVLKNIRGVLQNNNTDTPPPPPYSNIKNSMTEKSAGVEILPQESSTPLNTKEGVSKEKEIEFINGINPIIPKMVQNETKVLEVSGIDLVNQPKVAQDFIPNSNTINETLSGIENPISGVSSILGAKLSKPTVTPKEVSDHSVTKNDTSTPVRKNDPYREVVE